MKYSKKQKLPTRWIGEFIPPGSKSILGYQLAQKYIEAGGSVMFLNTEYNRPDIEKRLESYLSDLK